jgi:epsilon-lactone hydrolase
MPPVAAYRHCAWPGRNQLGKSECMLNLPLPLFIALLRLSGRKQRFASAANLRAAAAVDRQAITGAPPPRLTRRYAINRVSVLGSHCYTLAPRSSPGQQHVLYLHGGAYVTEMARAHWEFLAALVDSTHCVVHVPIFPLAPEHTHRETMAMVTEVYRGLSGSIASENLVLMGDSSGGGLALLLAQRLPTLSLPQPRDIVLISPWLDLTGAHAKAAVRNIDDPWLAIPGMEEAARWWAGGCDPAEPQVSPLYGALAGLGRLTVLIGTRDLLVAECRDLHSRALSEGIELRWIEAPGMIHVWPLLPLRQGEVARAAIAAIVRDHS